MADHSPLPWHIENEPFNVWDEQGRLIARVHATLKPEGAWDRGCANARLIVRAVNSHEALLAALKIAECVLRVHEWQIDAEWGEGRNAQQMEEQTAWSSAVYTARAALALAESPPLSGDAQ